MVGDGSAEAVSRRAVAGLLSAGLLSAGLLSIVLLAGCANARTSKRPPRAARSPTATVAAVDISQNPHLADWHVVEVAITAPDGSVSLSLRTGFREGLYAGLLERRYSPLDPVYVDAAGPDVVRERGPFLLRSGVTKSQRAADGGVVVSGWCALIAARKGQPDETLFLAEVADLAIRPTEGTDRRHGGPVAGKKLAEALLRKLPAR